MPLRHSPQHTPITSESMSALLPQTYDSDTPSERSGSSNINVRTKRRREPDEDVKDLKTEMRDLFFKLSTSVEQQFQAIKQQNIALQESLQFMSEKYDSVLQKIKNIEGERSEDGKKIQMLEERVDFLERKIRATSLEIRNIPLKSSTDKSTETKDEMCRLVKSLARSVNVNLQEEQIKDIYRIRSKKDTNKPLIIEFNSTLTKDNILRGVKTFNKDKAMGEKLNTNHLNIPGPSRPVYVSEALNQKTQKLFYMAREFAKENSYSYCWTSKGSIYLRKTEGQPLIHINSEVDLIKIRNK
ncbi:unnamed protein product [Diatraea saccharalis]|uniref:FP protein C-terminal domain-containing protein n=1 Tax=Diatraea saccharalis TaxID=40085 RepID=A0A9N9WF17_9NEOP|nr:unnamed protein product [Diatraea saccharalis]